MKKNNNQLILDRYTKYNIYASEKSKNIVKVIYATEKKYENEYDVEIDFLYHNEKMYNTYYNNNIKDAKEIDSFCKDFGSCYGFRIWQRLNYGETNSKWNTDIDVRDNNGRCIDGLKQLCNHYKIGSGFNPVIAHLLTKCIDMAKNNFKVGD